MERLQSAMAEFQAALNDSRREVEAARRREAELEVALEAERSQFAARESALLDANARLLARVDELSHMVSKLQNEIMVLTRTQNQQLVRGATPAGGVSTARQPVFGSPPGTPPQLHALTLGYTPLAQSDAPYMAPTPALNTDARMGVSRGPVPDAGTVLAVIDRSLDSFKNTAASDLERYTEALRNRVASPQPTLATAGALPSAPLAVNISSAAGEELPGPASAYFVAMPLTPPASFDTLRANDAHHALNAQAADTHADSSARVLGAGATAQGTPAASSTPGARTVSRTPAPAPVHTPAAAQSATNGTVAAASGIRPPSRQGAVPGSGTGGASTASASRGAAAAPAASQQAASGRRAVGHPLQLGPGVIAGSTSGPGYSARAAAGVSGSSRSGVAGGQRTAPLAAPAASAASAGTGHGATPKPEVRAAPYDDVVMEKSQAVSAPATAAAAPMAAPTASAATPGGGAAKKMAATEFFALLRAHSSPTGLQALMTTLAKFNSGGINRTELMRQAAAILAPAPGAAPPPVDLLRAFEDFMRK